MEHASREALLLQLAGSAQRSEVARKLAQSLGAEELVVLVRDPEVAALIPPPGFTPTLHGGPDWRALVRRCMVPGAYSAEVDLPAQRRRNAVAIACEGLALVLLGEAPSAANLASLRGFLPVLAFAFGAEQKAHVAAAQAAEATKAAARAHALAEALDAARADASRLNAELRLEQQRKDHFLAMLAHELRNPLSPLIHSLDLLRLGAGAADATLRERVEVMSRHAGQLAQLVDDLLDVARVSRGRITLRRDVLALQDVARDAVEANAHLIATRGHRLRATLGDPPLLVDGDRTRLTQVFWNLLHNAAKYTEPGGCIEVRAFRDERGQANVEVCDNGSGIDAENLGQIFTLFHQAPVALARSSGGLGIGLTLARTLVELHGGRIEARSDGLGKGSTFRVILPISRREPAPEHGRRQPSALPPAQGLRILVVDDNQDAADALNAVLKALGHQPQAAYGGASALQVAADLNPDLVFLDLGLPGVDGYEVARRLRRTLARHPYLVALTGYSGPEYAQRAHDAGFDEHVVKPVTLETIQAVAERASRPKAKEAT